MNTIQRILGKSETLIVVQYYNTIKLEYNIIEHISISIGRDFIVPLSRYKTMIILNITKIHYE